MNTPMDNWGYNDPAESEEPMTPDELRRSIFGESGVDSDTHGIASHGITRNTLERPKLRSVSTQRKACRNSRCNSGPQDST